MPASQEQPAMSRRWPWSLGSALERHGAERAKLRSVRTRDWGLVVRHLAAHIVGDRITTIAASLAFHGFLALLPLLLAIVALLDIVGLSQSALHTLLHDTSVLLPGQMSEVVNKEIASPPGHGTTVIELAVALAVALWSSIEAMSTLEIALDVAYDIERDRGFLGKRLIALPLIGSTIVLGGAASVLVVLGGQIRSLLPGSLA
ncbi:MAG: YhjD/YihY/BrkB family envelope integrity protein, partial [Solirubrobacteraceae bacterium]